MDHRTRLSHWARHGAGLPQAVATLGAALVGLGVVFWVAANWQHWPPMAQFAILQGAWLAFCLGAAQRPTWRTPLAVVAFAVLGGLLACFGQTYQTGADPWTLFAGWAVLGLPLCLAVRRDGLWAAWALVTMTGVSLWWQTWQGPLWRAAGDWGPMWLAWGVGAALSLALHPTLHAAWARWTGSGRVAWLTALLLTLVMLGAGTLVALVGSSQAGPWADTWTGAWAVAVLLLAGLMGATVRARPRDVAALSAQALLGNVLVIGALAKLLFQGARSGDLGAFLLIGVVAMGLLAATVTWILRWARADHSDQAGDAATGQPGGAT